MRLFSFEADAMLVDDREDLIAVLQMRFSNIPGEVVQRIYEIDDLNALQRLILVAANAPDWQVFMEELGTFKGSYRLVGESFNPIVDLWKGRISINGEEEK